MSFKDFKKNKRLKYLFKNKALLLVLLIFFADFFLKIYQMDLKYPFGYDQVDNAWAAKNFIFNHQIPLVGMVAKTDSGIFIGPAYYYIVSLFYWISNFNPVASEILALLTGIFTFWVLYYVGKKLFSVEVAIIAVLVYTFNFYSITFDGIQWPVQLLPATSFLIFYFLYKVITGNPKYIIALSLAIGFAFNLHFTAIFFPIIVILSLPLFPRTKETLKYILISIPLFLVWFVPNIIAQLQSGNSQASHLTGYISTYYHGFHLVRMRQLLGDALIQFDTYIYFEAIKPLKIFLLPLFFFVYLYKSFTSEKKKFSYLVILWFLVPWLVFTTYAGEITDYYFIISRFVALMIFAYLIYRVWNLKYIFAKGFVVVFLVCYCYLTFNNYFHYTDGSNLPKQENQVIQAVNQGKRIQFQVGVPESYLYWYYMWTLKRINVY